MRIISEIEGATALEEPAEYELSYVLVDRMLVGREKYGESPSAVRRGLGPDVVESLRLSRDENAWCVGVVSSLMNEWFVGVDVEGEGVVAADTVD